MKMETCKKSELNDDSSIECPPCWIIGTEKDSALEPMILMKQSTLRQLTMPLLHNAMAEVMGPLGSCGREERTHQR